MTKARASGSKVYLYFMKKGRQARHRIPRNSCFSVNVLARIDFLVRQLWPLALASQAQAKKQKVVWAFYIINTLPVHKMTGHWRNGQNMLVGVVAD